MPKRIFALFRDLFRSSTLERELDEELRSTVEILTEEKKRQGIPPPDARRQALMELGGVEQIKEEVRSVRIGRLFHDVANDVRFGMRLLHRNPGFTAVAAITLALGIGANTAIFSVVNTVVMRPLRYPDSDRMMAILSTATGVKGGFGSAQGVYQDWRDRATSFDVVAGARPTSMILSGTGQPRSVEIAATSFDFLSVLGKQPILGRMYSKEEDQPGHGGVALLDGGFWQREFAGTEKVLGRTIFLNDTPYTIIGVLPADIRFAYFGKTDIWIPLRANRAFRTGGDVIAVGRLRPGITREAAQAEMDTVMGGIGREHIEDFRTGVLVTPLQDWVVGDMRLIFFVIWGAAGFLLLICCANLANLLMTRSTARQREMAIRAGLGADRLRLIRQMLVESVLLAVVGGTIGLGLAAILVRAVPAIRAFRIPRVDEIVVDHTVLWAAAVLSLATGIVFGLIPAVQTRCRDLGQALRAQARWSPGGQRLRNVFVVTQLALALVLLCGAGLMTNSLLRMLNIDLGFQPSNVLTIKAPLPPKKYDKRREFEFQRQLASEVSRMPGVILVSASDYLPLQAVHFPMQLRADGTGLTPHIRAQARHIDPHYLRVIGIPLLAGRDLEPADDSRKPVPVLISRKAAVALFGLEDPLGRQLLCGYHDLDPLQVIGVVGNAHQIGLTREPDPQVYIPLARGRTANYVVAWTAPNSGDLTGAIHAAVRTIDPEVPVPVIGDMDEWFSREVAKPRFYVLLFGAFAALGFILAAVGIYGVASYGVALRANEFGIRMALGADRADILRLVLRSGLRLTCFGAVLGLAGSFFVTRLLSALLYQVRPNDPLTFGCASALLAGIALLACYVAARRAAGLDPNVTLKYE